MIQMGKKYRVYMEDGNGQIMELDAFAIEISVRVDTVPMMEMGGTMFAEPVPIRKHIDLRLQALGDITWTDSESFIEDKRTAKEWKCEFCGLPNIVVNTFCGENHHDRTIGCGAVRSFLYNL